MAKCKVCGAELVKGDLFCGECGAKVEPQTDEEDVSQDEDEEEVEETPAASSTGSGSQSSGDSNDPDNGLIPCCVLSIVGIIASAALLNRGWNKIGGILAVAGAFFALPSAEICARLVTTRDTISVPPVFQRLAVISRSFGVVSSLIR